jgi:hypothetical protein
VRWVNSIALVALICGVATGFVMMLIAIDHNPQGALIHLDNRSLDFRYALALFFSWFLASAVMVASALSVLLGAIVGVKRLVDK